MAHASLDVGMSVTQSECHTLEVLTMFLPIFQYLLVLTNSYKFLQNLTSSYKFLQALTSSYKFFQVLTSCYKFKFLYFYDVDINAALLS